MGLLLPAKPQFALAVTNTWSIKYLVHKHFPLSQHSPCSWALPYLKCCHKSCHSKLWLMNHVSATDDSTLMQFPLSSCIVNFHCQCCSTQLPPDWWKSISVNIICGFVQLCAHMRDMNGSTPTDDTTQHPAVLLFTSHILRNLSGRVG